MNSMLRYRSPPGDSIIDPAKSLIKDLKNLNIQEMEKLVSSWFNNKTLPQSYIFPPETRPGNHVIPRCNTIPVVYLMKALAHDRTAAVQQILKASQDFGFSNVINHGVSENLVNDTMNVFKEFFELPAEDKAGIYSEDLKRPCRLYTSSPNFNSEKVHLWRDNLRHPCHPLEDCVKIWPQKPTRYRKKNRIKLSG
ncbi:hyoscyamine 6-dioxygenase [Gossypium hirsutum]|uniref:Hyoscyamine 6-dioxygenase n=1 Tax=Gossypium hirsutum TaxID=3635 RepID=A0ABM2YN62_GOSHI|nr:hyoscyamine 6-dioxygenase-like [Gossypium hirsutum]